MCGGRVKMIVTVGSMVPSDRAESAKLDRKWHWHYTAANADLLFTHCTVGLVRSSIFYFG